MKIIIVGNGKVGYAIANSLAQEDHDIVMVDANTNALRKAESTMDVLCVEGNGASISVLLEAGVRTADLVISVTNQDEINLVCCLIAKKLGAGHTIARVRNTDYRRDEEMLKKEIGLDMVINPDLAAAQEMARILAFPAAFSVEPFARGRIDMIGFQVTENDNICGVPLSQSHRLRQAEVLICAAEHQGDYIIPDGSYAPAAGDRVYMLGAKPELQRMLKEMGRSWQKVKKVSVLRIVEMDADKCLRLSAQLPHVLVIQGDGTDNTLLQQEGILDTDAFVAVTNRDEENLLMAMHAQRSGVPKVLAKMTRPNYMELVNSTGIDSIISPKDIISSQILRYVRALGNAEGSKVESLYKMLGGHVEALSFTVAASSRAVLGKPLKDLPLRKGLLVAAIVRDDKTIIPSGMTTIEDGDHVVVVTRATGLDDLTDILA